MYHDDIIFLLSRDSGVSFFPAPSGVLRHQKTEKVGTLRKYPRNKMGRRPTTTQPTSIPIPINIQ